MIENRQLHRFCVPHLPEAGGEIHLDRGESHHATAVLRLKQGCQVELFDGRGGGAVGRIAAISRREIVILLERLLPKIERLGTDIHVAFSVPKGRRLDWLLEKATELGAAALEPVIFARSVAGGDEMTSAKRRRWQGICIAAAKQCRNNFLPALVAPARFDEYLAAAGGDDVLKLLGDPSGDALSLPEAMSNFPAAAAAGPIRILVGPEGALTAQEQSAAIDGGFYPVRLGGTILRSETAAVALLAAVVAMQTPPAGDKSWTLSGLST